MELKISMNLMDNVGNQDGISFTDIGVLSI